MVNRASKIVELIFDTTFKGNSLGEIEPETFKVALDRPLRMAIGSVGALGSSLRFKDPEQNAADGFMI